MQTQHHACLGQAKLLVIDEAAAIPKVKVMLGPYLVFLAQPSTGEHTLCHRHCHCLCVLGLFCRGRGLERQASGDASWLHGPVAGVLGFLSLVAGGAAWSGEQ